MMYLNEQEFYCKLFIDLENFDYDEANHFIIELTKGTDDSAITTNNMSIDVMRNDAHNDPKYGKAIPWGTIDEFLYYKYFLDIFPKDENIDKNEYKKEIIYLLEQIWQKGYKAVAAWGFEEELPRNGGMGYDPKGKTKFRKK